VSLVRAAGPSAEARRADPARAAFAADVREHLARRPRQLPTRYLYDELGSALFEAICALPWYGITRAEERLIAAARDDIAQRLAPVRTIVELGSGSGQKLRILLGARGLAAQQPTVHLVDVSASALDAARHTLASIPSVRVIGHAATYEEGLAEATRDFDRTGRVLALFLGSNIGNFDSAESRAFLRAVRSELRAADALLIGADLVKPERQLLAAYDDPLGVTGAFNRNLLVRVNRELGADFDLDRWAHRALWNESASRVEMHLVALADQRVRIPAAEVDVELARGETLWTESSHKYRTEEIEALLDDAGFRVGGQWIDGEDGFALTLAEAT
jgi:L-histidine Nalpha-methyltransferase